MSRLVAKLDLASGGGLTVVTGPQGIGKTRLVDEVAAIARARGTVVATGRAWLQGDEPAYWHWSQVFSALLPDRVGTALEDLLLDRGAPSDRLDLFDEAATLLAQATEDRPVLIVLDDLHAAGTPTLLLTRFLTEQLATSSVLILATCRPGDESTDPAVEAHLHLLNEVADTLMLDGLSSDAVAAMVAPVDVVRELHSVTGGNPLFIEQFVRSSAAPEMTLTGGDDALATLTRSRVARLSAPTRDALRALAVLGGSATADDLASVLAASPSSVSMALEATLDDAVRLRSDGTYAFTHAVFAAVSYVDDQATRVMHLRAADLIGNAPGRESVLAQHLASSGPAGAVRAPLAFLDAGRAATAELAYESAASHYSRAIALLDESPAATAGHRVAALVGLGRARTHLGEHDAARAAFDDAWLAARDGRPSDVAAAALGPELGFGFVPGDQPTRAARCIEALARLDGQSAPLEARLTATLATQQLATVETAVARETAETAHRLAVASDDAVALGAALVALSVTDLGPDSMERRLTMARQILALADTLGDQALARTGHFLLLAALLESGDVRAVDAELASRRRVSAHFAGLESTRHTLWFRCMRALLDGRIDESERLAAEALATAQSEGDADALSVYVGQLGIVRWMQGREGEVEPLYLSARQSQPGEAVWSAVLARLWALDGRLQAAQGAISSLGDVTAIPRDRNWLLTIATLAEAAVIVGDRDVAAQLRNELLPYSQRLVPIGLGIACWGTVARPLALLSGLLGRTTEAEAHFRTAMRVCSEAGALPWLAQAQCELTDLIHADRPDEAAALLTEAEATVARLGVVALEPECAQRRARLGSVGVVVDAASPDPSASSDRPVVRVLGTFEVVGLDGVPASWTSRKARELLKLLVARRGAPITREAIMDALWPDEDPRALSNRLSVALTTVRRAFDPRRSAPADEFIASDNQTVQLRVDRITVDGEQFLIAATEVLAERRSDTERVRAAVELFRGAALADEPYAEWAAPFRREVQTAFARVARLLADRAEADGDDLVAADTYRKLLVEDPFDEHAHRGLIRTLARLGAHGQASAADREYQQRMAEIGVVATPIS